MNFLFYLLCSFIMWKYFNLLDDDVNHAFNIKPQFSSLTMMSFHMASVVNNVFILFQLQLDNRIKYPNELLRCKFNYICSSLVEIFLWKQMKDICELFEGKLELSQITVYIQICSFKLFRTDWQSLSIPDWMNVLFYFLLCADIYYFVSE